MKVEYDIQYIRPYIEELLTLYQGVVDELKQEYDTIVASIEDGNVKQQQKLGKLLETTTLEEITSPYFEEVNKVVEGFFFNTKYTTVHFNQVKFRQDYEDFQLDTQEGYMYSCLTREGRDKTMTPIGEVSKNSAIYSRRYGKVIHQKETVNIVLILTDTLLPFARQEAGYEWRKARKCLYSLKDLRDKFLSLERQNITEVILEEQEITLIKNIEDLSKKGR